MMTERRHSRLALTVCVLAPSAAVAQPPIDPVISPSGISVTPAATSPGQALAIAFTVQAGPGTVPSQSNVAVYVVDPSGATVGSLLPTAPMVIAAGKSATETLDWTLPAGAVAGQWRVVAYVRDRSSGQGIEFPDAHFAVQPPAAPTNLIPTLNDSFAGGAVNPAIWSPFYPAEETIGQGAWLPDELQPIPGGGVELRADRRPTPGHAYAGGVLTTFGGFAQTYGVFQVQARMPAGNGFWPAFWMLPIDQGWPPEIDVTEQLGSVPGVDYTTLHFPTAGGGRAETDGRCAVANPSGQYHLYGIAWRPGSLAWSVDGRTCFAVTGPTVPSKPMYLLLDLAIGAPGGWGGAPDATTPFPGRLDIASVRAWQYPDLAPPAPPALAFGKTAISTAAPAPGQTMRIVSGYGAGAAPIVGLAAQATIFPSGAQVPVGISTVATAGTVAARSHGSLAMSWVVPGGLPAGLYDVAVQMVGSGGAISQWQYVAQQFRIGAAPPIVR